MNHLGPEESHNPWKTLSEKEIYENKWIKLTEFQVLNPAGNPGIYGVIHFQNNAVGVVPYENGFIWMVGQFRYPLNRFSWEIPEGGGPLDISTLEAAVRELKEETGMTAANYEKIVEMHLSNSVSDEYAIIYLATELTHGEAEPEETEELHLRKIQLEDAYALVEKGLITDSLTVAAIYKLMLMKADGRLR
ncbi:MAG: NUDIX hydrolase [Bacteroidia bacterium]|nr:NUDIX hydrolase [Bacteroidia bacterium]